MSDNDKMTHYKELTSINERESVYFSKEGEAVKALDPNWANHVKASFFFVGFKQ